MQSRCGGAAESTGDGASAVAVVYLIVFGSIIAFSAYRYALQHLPVATVSSYVYVNTVIAVILGTSCWGNRSTGGWAWALPSCCWESAVKSQR